MLTGFWKTSQLELENMEKGVKVNFTEPILITTIQLEKQGNEFNNICISIDDEEYTCSNQHNDNKYVVWTVNQIAKVVRWKLPDNEYITVRDFKIFYEVIQLHELSTPEEIKSQLIKPRYDNGVLKFLFNGKEYFKIEEGDHGKKTNSLEEANKLCSIYGGAVVMPKTIEDIDFLSNTFLRYWRQPYDDLNPNRGTETEFWINLISNTPKGIMTKYGVNSENSLIFHTK